MKLKKITAVLAAAMAAVCLLAGCTVDSEPAGGSASSVSKGEHKVGITVQSLKNAYWAGVMEKLGDELDKEGWEYTLVDCESNAGTQVGQIENFIASGCDLILVHPADAAAIENICGEAKAAGIKIMCWDDVMENSDANWNLDNEVLGKEIARSAADFINEHYTSEQKAKVTVIGYPALKACLDRADGIKAGLEEYCEDNYEIVAEVDGVEANEAQSNVETVLSTNPDAKIFVGIGAGACIGANEALIQTYGAGKIPEDCGVITTDITVQQLESLKAGDEAVRAIIGFEGSNVDTAKACVEVFKKIYAGEYNEETKNVIRPTMEITVENIDEILSGM